MERFLSQGPSLEDDLRFDVAEASVPATAEGLVAGAATLKYLEVIFANVISVVLALAGIVLFIMLIYGGFKYLTAGGDPKALEGAKGTLSHAILGLVTLVLAFIILKVIAEVTGVSSILNFQIYR